jgi:hypothetical protein
MEKCRSWRVNSIWFSNRVDMAGMDSQLWSPSPSRHSHELDMGSRIKN